MLPNFLETLAKDPGCFIYVLLRIEFIHNIPISIREVDG
jgi:hypothetical protein